MATLDDLIKEYETQYPDDGVINKLKKVYDEDELLGIILDARGRQIIIQQLWDDDEDIIISYKPFNT